MPERLKRELDDIATTVLGCAALVCIAITCWNVISGAGLLAAGLPAGLALVAAPLWATAREAINERQRIARDADMKRHLSQLIHPSNQPLEMNP